jgi:hypothetical protein
MTFVNSLPYISNPIEEFRDFKFVNWERGIYPKFKGQAKKEEIKFFTDIIVSHSLRRVIDLGVGGGIELSNIVKELEGINYRLKNVEANEVDEDFIEQARKLFEKSGQKIKIHKANWFDLPKAAPAYKKFFDFGFLTGNSLTYIGGGTREYTKKAQQIVVNKFSQLIKRGGYILIDSRDYDYIKSLMNLPKEDIFKNFTFDFSVYYHGDIFLFPAYISDTVVVLHYYDQENKLWSKLDLYPIYQKDMIEILSKDFRIRQIYYDFERKKKKKNLFIQYLVQKK